MVNRLEAISQAAVIPDQIVPYVIAVSGMEPHLCEDCLLYRLDEYGVLIGWKNGRPLDQESLDSVAQKATEQKGLRHLTVISSLIPSLAPKNAEIYRDQWQRLELPLVSVNSKLANMLRRASQETVIDCFCGASCFGSEHKDLAGNFCMERKQSLNEASRYIFSNLDKYLASCAEALLFSARDRQGRLQAFAIGDFSSFSTAFYMFAMRSQSAPPGTADMLLGSIIEEAEKRGMNYLNLGLGINSGIEFFKRKWGAKAFYPHVESSWEIPSSNFFTRLFGRKNKQRP